MAYKTRKGSTLEDPYRPTPVVFDKLFSFKILNITLYKLNMKVSCRCLRTPCEASIIY